MTRAAAAPRRLAAGHDPVVRRLLDRARTREWPVHEDAFRRALEASLAWRFADARPGDAEVAAYLDSLHVEDLGLACACAAGDERAWEHFVREFRPVLYRCAAAAAPPEQARDLADSLYAELFGLTEREGERRSLFAYYHGRASLGGWLRSVLAQRAVDLARAQRRTQPLDADGMASRAGADAGPADPRRPGYAALLSAALFAVLATLASRDRLRLALYHGQGLTLAEAGRVLGESEATVSRKLERARRVLRDGTARRLREVDRLGEAEVDACFEHAVEDWQGDLIGVLQEPLSPTFSRQEDTG